MDKASIADLSGRLAGKVDGVVGDLFKKARRSRKFWHIGNASGDVGDSLYIHRSGAKAGNWTDAATGDFGDLLDLIQAALRTDLHGACNWARNYLGIVNDSATRRERPAEIEARQRKHEEEDREIRERRIRRAHRVIDSSRPVFGTQAEQYLRSRCLEPRRGLGFNQACPHPDGFKMPAMIAPVRHVEHGIVSVHCTFLESGRKAPISKPKIIYGPCGGGAVHFGEPVAGAWLAVAEGIENALTVSQTSEISAWAALSAGGIETLVLPPEAQLVLIAADNDTHGRGERAARTAATRWIGEGRRVRIAMPTGVGTDFNDILCGNGSAKVQGAHHVAA